MSHLFLVNLQCICKVKFKARVLFVFRQVYLCQNVVFKIAVSFIFNSFQGKSFVIHHIII
jgi:hypothetical protein